MPDVVSSSIANFKVLALEQRKCWGLFGPVTTKIHPYALKDEINTFMSQNSVVSALIYVIN